MYMHHHHQFYMYLQLWGSLLEGIIRGLRLVTDIRKRALVSLNLRRRWAGNGPGGGGGPNNRGVTERCWNASRYLRIDVLAAITSQSICVGQSRRRAKVEDGDII